MYASLTIVLALLSVRVLGSDGAEGDVLPRTPFDPECPEPGPVFLPPIPEPFPGFPEPGPTVNPAVGRRVNTTSGIVVGHPTANYSTVSEYLGIKFAQTPSGSLRFMAPQKYTSKETFNASSYSAACPSLSQLATSSNTTISDDCLSVNVWTKPEAGKLKAVMIWIYGGGFSTGASSDVRSVGAKLAIEQDVVVVSLNYRTNIFGFPGSPDVPDANPAFLDQRMAIEWFRDNIRGFGGDPDRMIIFGQSAGASSVDYYSFIWTEDPIIKGTIAESGSALITGPFARASVETRHANWYKTSVALGCGGPEAGLASVSCVQNKTALEILNAMPQEVGLNSVIGDFGPTYDNKTVFYDYQNRSREGKFIRTPVLAGANKNESTLFAFLAATSGTAMNQTQKDGVQNGFNCPNDFVAQNRRNFGINAWRYFYMAEFPNAAVVPGVDFGTFHGAEVQQIFNTSASASTVPDIDGERQMRQNMQDAWGAFARDPVNGLVNKWPLYNSNGSTLVRIGFRNAVSPDFVDSKLYDGLCTAASISD